MEDNGKGPLAAGPDGTGVTTPQGKSLDMECPGCLRFHRTLLAFRRGSRHRLERLSISEARTGTPKGWRALGLELRLETSGGPGPEVRLFLTWEQARALGRFLALHPETREAAGPGGEA